MKLITSKRAQEIQDKIFKRMSVEKKIKLALNFSDFCLELHNLAKYGKRKTAHKNQPNFRKT